jgi:hypothetical protein
MCYQEKRTIATMVSNFIVVAAYIIFILQKNKAGMIDMGSDLKFWASTILVFLGITIIINIVIQIIFHIVS